MLWNGFKSAISLRPYRFLMLGILSISTSAMEVHKPPKETILFDFTSCDPSEADSWMEVSDTVREPGMSKAVFALQRTMLFQRGVMFAMINPQPNGAAFAGVQRTLPRGIERHTNYTGITLRVRGQGLLKYWKVVMVDWDQAVNRANYDYEHKFQLNLSAMDFEVVTLPFAEFKAYKWGKEIPDAPPFNFSKIGIFGLQTFGGVYDDFKQQGSGSLEIDNVLLY